MSKIEAWAVVDQQGMQYSDLCDTRKEASDQIRCAKLEYPEDSWRIVRLTPESEAATANEEDEVERKAWEFYLASLATETGYLAMGPYDALRLAEQFITHRNARRARLAAQPEKEAE